MDDKHPRFSDINVDYICACGQIVNRTDYLMCRMNHSHNDYTKTQYDDELGALDISDIFSNLSKLDSNIREYGFGNKGYTVIVYNRMEFMKRYSNESWIDKILLYQVPATLFDFSFKQATEDEIQNCIQAYPSDSCTQSFPCSHTVIIKMKNEGSPDDIYRYTNASSIDIYQKYELKGKLDLNRWRDHFKADYFTIKNMRLVDVSEIKKQGKS